MYLFRMFMSGRETKNFDLNRFISNIAKILKSTQNICKNDQLFELTKKNRSKIILFLAGTVTDWAQDFAKELKKIYE